MKNTFIIAVLLSVSIISVQSANAAEKESLRRRFRNGSSNNAFFGRMIAEEKIAAAFPEKYAALEAAREKYENELAELAKNAGVQLPPKMDENMRKIRKQFPAEFSAIVKEMETSPHDAMRKMRELAEKAGITSGMFFNPGKRESFNRRDQANVNQFARRIDRLDMAKLRRKYPDLMREYDAMRQSDPDAARNKLIEIIQKDRDEKK